MPTCMFYAKTDRKTKGRLWDIDLRDPLTNHELNQGRLAWWLILPSHFGGSQWWDVVKNYPMTLSGFPAKGGWSPRSYKGGVGSLISNSAGFGSATLPPQLIWGTSSFSLALWYMRSTNDTVTHFSLLGLGASGGVGNVVNLFQGISITTGSSPGNAFISFNDSSIINTWHRALFTCTKTTTILYLDGVQVATGTMGDASAITLLLPFNNVNRGFLQPPPTGTGLAGFTLWNRILSKSEAALDYNLGCQGELGLLQSRRRIILGTTIPTVSHSIAPYLNRQNVIGSGVF